MQIKVKDIKINMDLFPRSIVDKNHVEEIRQAYKANEKIPLIVIESGTNELIDGLHRLTAIRNEYGEDFLIEVNEISFNSEKEKYLAIIEPNLKHGKQLNKREKIEALYNCFNMDIASIRLINVFNMELADVQKYREKYKKIKKPKVDKDKKEYASKILAFRKVDIDKHTRQIVGKVKELIDLLEDKKTDKKDYLLLIKIRRLHEVTKKIIGV